MAQENLPTEQTTESSQSQTPTVERKKLSTLIKEWPLSRKLALVGVLAISVILFGMLIFQGRTADYQLLYANLAEKDAAPVITWLKNEKIPYQLKNNGKNIWIPANVLYETRLNLAANGLPSGGGIGFEVFDKQSFALTDYVQKVNYTRALQGELARTISSLAPVESARVHLALPEKRLFKDQQKQPSASVIVMLAQGKSLSEKQVQGIVHLIAGSISDMAPENITVVDSNGVALDAGLKEEEDKFIPVDMLAYQQEVEHRLEIRAQDLLDRTMGVDKAMVRVNADLDFSKVEKTQELFDAEEPVVRSEQINQEQSGAAGPAGIPGVESNLEGIEPLQGGGSASNRTSRTTNYEISKTVSRIINPVGTIQKLSVSILVADKEIPASGDTPGTTQPRTAEELQAIQAMVSAALGLVSERGDQINVQSMPFTAAAEKVAAMEPMPENLLYEYMPIVKIVLLMLGALLLYVLLVRPLIKTMRGEIKEHYKTVEALEQEQLESDRALQLEQDREARRAAEDPVLLIRKTVFDNPTPSAHILKHWLQET